MSESSHEPIKHEGPIMPIYHGPFMPLAPYLVEMCVPDPEDLDDHWSLASLEPGLKVTADGVQCLYQFEMNRRNLLKSVMKYGPDHSGAETTERLYTDILEKMKAIVDLDKHDYFERSFLEAAEYAEIDEEERQANKPEEHIRQQTES